MTKIEWLNQAHMINLLIKAKEEHLSQLQAEIHHGTQRITGMPRSGKVGDWTETAVEIINLEEEINLEIKRLMETKENHERYITSSEL